MATFSLNKKSENYRMIVFSDTYQKFSHLLEDGRSVIVEGLIQQKDDELQFYVYEICDLNTNISRYIEKLNFILSPDDAASDFIKKLRTLADEAYGDTKIGIQFMVNGHIVETKTAQSLSFSLSESHYNSIKNDPVLLGVHAESCGLKDFSRPTWKK